MIETKDSRTIGELFADLSQETRTLIQQEIQLARAEVTETAARVARHAAFIVAGGLLAYGGVLAIVATVVLLLIALGLPGWAGALIGGMLIIGIGYALIRSGLAALQRQELKPRKTIESLKEDAQWLKSQAR